MPENWKSLTTGEQFVKEALEIGAIELVPEGRTLKSGRLSPYFFNSGLFHSGASITMLARAYARTIRSSNLHYSVLFGPAYKGIPLVAATSMHLSEMKLPCDFTFNRKEAKDHGEGGTLVGASLAHRGTVIIDDVITNGAAKREAVEIITAAKGEPVGLVIAFDRKERGLGELSAAQEFEQQFKIPVLRVATIDDLIAVLTKAKEKAAKTPQEKPEHPEWIAALPAIEAYRAEYGVA